MVQALHFIGVVPPLIVPENPHARIAQADRYERDNARDSAPYYGFAVLPGPPVHAPHLTRQWLNLPLWLPCPKLWPIGVIMSPARHLASSGKALKHARTPARLPHLLLRRGRPGDPETPP